MPAPINSGSGGSSQSAVVRGGTLRGLPVAPPAPQIVAGPAASIGIGTGHLWVKHAGTWKEPKLQVNHGGTWKEPTAAYVKDAGTWKQFYAPVVLGDPTLVLDLDFTTGTLDSKVTFTRTTTATYVNSSGLVTAAAINAPRFDYDPATLTPRGLLIEEQRINLQTNSNGWGSWDTNGTTTVVTVNDITSPDGTINAARITETAISSMHTLYSNPAVSVTIAPHAASVFIKAGTRRYVQLGLGPFSNMFAVVVDTTTMTIVATGNNGSAIYSSSIIQSVGNGWYRVVFIGTPGASSVYFTFTGLDSPSFSGSPISSGSGTWYLYGAQVELGSFATSYIPTTSAAVTRAADSAVMTGTNFSSWWNASEGTFVARYKKLTVAGDNVAVQVNDGTGNEDMEMMHIGANPHMFVYDSGATQTFTSVGTITALTTNKFAFAYKLNDLAACVNGGTVATDTGATIPTVDRLGLGINPSSGAFIMSGWYERLTYYNVRKTNAELQALTYVPVPPSYANPGGTGDRTASIIVTTTAALGTGVISNLVNGSQANDLWFVNAQTDKEIKFDFGGLKVIDEAKWYQDAATFHGTFQWQGSTDNVNWTDIGATFTLGGVATQTQTTLNGNTTPYRYYRLLQTAGNLSSTPYLREIEFKIG